MNTSLLETAETVDAGHFKLGFEGNLALDLSSAVLDEADSRNLFEIDELVYTVVFGLKGGLGVTDFMEINGKTWGTFVSSGSKLYLKTRLTQRDRPFAVAIAPAITWVSTDAEGVESTTLDTIVRSRGGELPILLSYRFDDNSAVYGAVRYSFDRLRIERESEPEQRHTVHRIGLVTGYGFNANQLYLRPEIGFEAAKQINGGFKAVPIFSFGLGFDF